MRPSNGIIEFGGQKRNFARRYFLYRIETDSAYQHIVTALADKPLTLFQNAQMAYSKELNRPLASSKMPEIQAIVRAIKRWGWEHRLLGNPDILRTPAFDEWLNWQNWRVAWERNQPLAQEIANAQDYPEFVQARDWLKWLYDNRPQTHDQRFETEWETWIQEVATYTLRAWASWASEERDKFWTGEGETRLPVLDPPAPLPRWDTFWQTDESYLSKVKTDFPNQYYLHSQAKQYIRACLEHFNKQGAFRVKKHREFATHMGWFMAELLAGKTQKQITDEAFSIDELAENTVSKAIRGIAEVLDYPRPEKRGRRKNFK